VKEEFKLSLDQLKTNSFFKSLKKIILPDKMKLLAETYCELENELPRQHGEFPIEEKH